MTYLSILLGLIMLLFAGVQYNDPDGPLWVVIYGVPAAWAFLAAFKLPAVRSRTGTLLLWLTIATAFFGVIYYWPQTPNFWLKDIWWEDEAAREGMGLMIVLLVLLMVRMVASRGRSPRL